MYKKFLFYVFYVFVVFFFDQRFYLKRCQSNLQMMKMPARNTFEKQQRNNNIISVCK